MIGKLLRRGYAALPSDAQSLAISVAGLRWRHERFGGEFPALLEGLQRSEWWSADRILQFETERIRSTVRSAYESVPYYRELLDGVGATPDDIRDAHDLSKLPLLTKAIVKEQGTRMLAAGARNLVRMETSGTTGKPLTIWKSLHTHRFQWAVWWRHRARFGLRLGDPFLSFGARVPALSDEGALPIWRTNLAVRQTYLPVFQLTAETMPAVVDWLNTRSFDFFAGYPSGMAILARFMRERDLRLHRRPKVVTCGSETLLPEVAELLHERFGARVTQLYGMGESAGGFAECEQGRLHADFELGLIELLPVPGSDDPDLRRLVLTGFESHAMPFIRYDVGDYVRISRTPCSCGRQSMTVDSVDGRLEDCVQTPDGRKLFGLNQVFKLSKHVREAQVVQNTIDEIEVRIVRDAKFEPSEEQVLRDELRLRAGGRLRIRFTYLEAIPVSANGKFRAVVSRMSAA